MRKLHILDGSGHTTLTSPGDLSEAEVKEKFDEMTGKGYLAYKGSGATKEQVKTFDEVGQEEEVVFHAPLAGG